VESDGSNNESPLLPNGLAVQLRPAAAGGAGWSIKIDAKRLTHSIGSSGGVAAAMAC